MSVEFKFGATFTPRSHDLVCERLNFAATANSGGLELRSQATPPPPVTWPGELRREDGHVVARIGGHHSRGTPTQRVGLELQGVDRDFAFHGTLKR